jgi:hypothetical protein
MQNDATFKATRMSQVAEEIVAEIIFCPGSIQALRLQEKIDAFATVVDYCQDIMYVRVEAAATIPQQIQTTAAVIRDIFVEYRPVLQGLGVTFYFNQKFYQKWKLRQIEQSYTLRLREYLGDGLHRKYYNADEDLKLEFRFNPTLPLQEQAEAQALKTA